MTGRVQLRELAVSDLGIIDQLRIVPGDGMTALTGETGAGKTLLVGAIDLLLGGRADIGLVRSGAAEAVVEGRFEVDGEELILSRVIPASGRSRAYVNGRMVTAGALAAEAAELVDLHGQHAQQSLLDPAVQRDALDRFGGIDLAGHRDAQAQVRELRHALDALGGDEGVRSREVDLLRFQLAELEAARIDDPSEDQLLDAEEDRLAGAEHHRLSAATAAAAIAEDGGAIDTVGAAMSAIDGSGPLADLLGRLQGVQAELSDLAAELRDRGEGIEDDPARLEAVRLRRQVLVDLRRKYGTSGLDGSPRAGTLADVMTFHQEVAARLAELESHDARAAEISRALAEAQDVERREAAALGAARRSAAPLLAARIQDRLRELAMPDARILVEVGDRDPGDAVTFMLAANPGAGFGPLSRIASGGELSRTMLALRLVVGADRGVLVFDEVDAGIGGEAALAVGSALAALGGDAQVLVVTHLPQVAAFAHHQIRIAKEVRGGTTVSSAAPVADEDRIIELSRMLSGTPESETVHVAASELLALAASRRDGP